MAVDVLLGLQWGDEGKGKIVDFLAPQYDAVARFQGGPNAGHTLYINGKKHVLHTIPSGVFHDKPINIIGNGVVIDPITFQAEANKLTEAGADLNKKLFIAKKAHLILPTHKILDAASEASKGSAKIGSTLKGIGPTYMDKTGRNGLRVGDILSSNFLQKYNALKEKHESLLKLYDYSYDITAAEKEWMQSISFLRSMNLIDCEYFIQEMISNGKSILAEGAQGSMLDIDFGTYPFVTSSNTITAAACTGLGIAPKHIAEVIGITKAYCTRVGSGPFPTELNDETGELLRKEGNEFGATTGRPRRCGWIDIPALNYVNQLNGVSQLIITKADVLNIFDEIKICTSYKVGNQISKQIPFDICDSTIESQYESMNGWKSTGNANSLKSLPVALQQFVQHIEQLTNVKVTYISVGPEREQLIACN